MDVGALARLEHENMIEALWAVATQGVNARIERTNGVALVATGLPLRLFNQVLVEDDHARPEAVAAAVATTRGRGDWFIVSLRAGTDDRYFPLMAELGLVRVSDRPWMPGMALHPLPSADATPVPPGHEIRRITTAAGVNDHVRTAAAGFEMPQAWLEAVVTEALINHPGAALYVGYTDGLPVTTGLGIRTGETIGVYNIATVESARRRGYGAAMTMRIVDDAAAARCDVAILQSSDMGRPIYERLGFRTVVEYIGFVEPDSPQD